MEDKAQRLDASTMRAEIDQLEQRAIRLRLPNAYDSSLYNVRVHIGLLRSHLESILLNENIQREDNRFPRSRRGSGLSEASPPDQKLVSDRTGENCSLAAENQINTTDK